MIDPNYKPTLYTPLLNGVGSFDMRKSVYSGNHQNLVGEVLEDDFPKPNWITARHGKEGRTFPQIIAHRGYQAQYPENTMPSFIGAVEAGAHALETDIHLTRDDVVVLSHDADLQRCFGRSEKIVDCSWDFLSQQRTIAYPRSPMPRFTDLLEYLSQPELSDIWLMLDIKLDNDAEKVMRLIANSLAMVSSPCRPWKDRVVLGIWTAKYLPLCIQYLPGYPVCHIGFTVDYARQFLKVPNVSLSINQRLLTGPTGRKFIRDVQRARRPLYSWTINDRPVMKWAIHKQLDGVITDDPKLFKQICDDWDQTAPEVDFALTRQLYSVWLYLLFTVLTIIFKIRFPETVESFLKKNNVRAKAAFTVDAIT